MNHDLVEVNGFDIDCYRAFSSTRESLYVYKACNKLSAHSKTEKRRGERMAERRGRKYILGRLRGGCLLNDSC